MASSVVLRKTSRMRKGGRACGAAASSPATCPAVKCVGTKGNALQQSLMWTRVLAFAALLVLAALTTSSAILHCVAASSSTTTRFSLQYSYTSSGSGKTFSEASTLCRTAGMTLPVLDSAAKNGDLVTFISSSSSISAVVGPYAFVSAGVTGNCETLLASGSCYVYRTGVDGTTTNIARITGTSSFTPVNGEYVNFADGMLGTASVYVTVDKTGAWSGALRGVAVPYVICEAASSDAAAGAASETTTNAGTIIGAVVGSVCGVALLAAIVVLVCCVCSRHKRAEEEKEKKKETELRKRPVSGKRMALGERDEESDEDDDMVRRFSLKASRRSSCNSRRGMSDADRVQPLSGSRSSLRSTRSQPVMRVAESGSDEDALHGKVKRFVDAVKRVQKKYPSFMPTICAALYRDPNANAVVTRALEENPLAKPLMRLAFDLVVSDEEKRLLNSASNHADLERDMLQFLDDTNDEFTTPENSRDNAAFENTE